MNTNNIVRGVFFGGLVIVLLAGGEANTARPQSLPVDKPVEQVRKNIQVLRGLPDSQLFLVMNFVGDSLGVNCDYCHVRGDKNLQTGEYNWFWEKDDKPTKQVGREQMRMTLELNRANFKGEPIVTCFTCHHGSLQPERMTPLPPHDYFGDSLKIWESGPTANASANKVLPTAPQIVAKYLSVVGANRKDVLLQAIVMKGTVERIDRAKGSGPSEIIFKQPTKARISEPTGSGLVTRGTNGTVAWSQTAKGVTVVPPERVRPSVASLALFNPIKLPESLSQTAATGSSLQVTVSGIARVNDRDTYLVVLDDSAAQSTQLFFDVQTGLLLRRVNVTNTMLGPLNVQWDFSDYRHVSGLKLPFTIRTSDVSSYDTTVRTFKEIRIDSSVDDSVFEVPKRASP
jgi:hypothetical protein